MTEKQTPGNLDSLDKHIPDDMRAAAAARPEPTETPLKLDISLDRDTVAEINRIAAKNRMYKRRLRQRKLERYVKVLNDFAALGKDQAFIKVDTKEIAFKLRYKLYFARAQERARVGDIQDTAEYVEQARRLEIINRLTFGIVELDVGWAIKIELEPEMRLSLE